MIAATPIRDLSEDSDKYVLISPVMPVTSPYASVELESETRPGYRLQGVITAAVAAMAMAASGLSPAVQRISRVPQSSSGAVHVDWVGDDWVFTTEPIDADDVEALNRLLALPLVEGLVLDLPED